MIDCDGSSTAFSIGGLGDRSRTQVPVAQPQWLPKRGLSSTTERGEAMGMIHGENLGEPRGSSYLGGGLASEAAKSEAGDVGHLKTVGWP